MAPQTRRLVAAAGLDESIDNQLLLGASASVCYFASHFLLSCVWLICFLGSSSGRLAELVWVQPQVGGLYGCQSAWKLSHETMSNTPHDAMFPTLLDRHPINLSIQVLTL